VTSGVKGNLVVKVAWHSRVKGLTGDNRE